MYCPSCGAASAPGLSYCNRCGANLLQLTNANEQPAVSLTGPAWALGMSVVAICTFGLKGLLNGIEDIAEHGVHPAALAWIGIAGSLVLLGSVALLCWLFSRMFKTPQRAIKPAWVKSGSLNEQRAPQQLGERPQPVGSVTDHTTRIFEPAYMDSSRKEPR